MGAAINESGVSTPDLGRRLGAEMGLPCALEGEVDCAECGFRVEFFAFWG
jgi:hypothetical protein